MEKELLQLAIALAVIALIVFLLRRASIKSRAQTPSSIQDRLGLRPEEEPRRERIRKPRPGQVEPEAAPKPKREAREAEAERAEPDEAVDADARDAYKAGL